MPSTKSATPPVPAGHATEVLRIGTADEIAALAKLSPVVLPNDALVTNLQQNHPNEPRWRRFRNDPNYIYVLNWMFQCRGYIKLASEHFDTDLFEMELFELVQPPPVDDMVLVINKAKLALISKVHGKKVSSLSMFESLFRVYFGSDTPLSGPTEEEEAESHQSVVTSIYPSFNDLYVDEKLSVLATLITEVSQYQDFREYIDKVKLSPEDLRLTSVARFPTGDKQRAEEYFSLFDGTALYKRVISAPEFIIPKKRKSAPPHPELHYPEDSFDISSIEFELVYKDIYGFNSFLLDSFKGKKLKINKAIVDYIYTESYISNMFSYEIKKRKIISGRRKEFEMGRLLATRKRSSRIEAKERQKNLEEQERKAQEAEDLKHATTRRSQRAQNLQEQKMRMDFTAGLSRGERLNLRKKGEESATPAETDSAKASPINGETAPIPIESSSPIDVDADHSGEELRAAEQNSPENIPSPSSQHSDSSIVEILSSND
ncbi:hypothetical protein OXX80_001034 [Metschnikowia pulcherrima]